MSRYGSERRGHPGGRVRPHTGRAPPSLVLLFAAGVLHGAVSVPEAHLTAGVRHAVERLSEVTKADVRGQVGGGQLPEGLAEAGEEAFALVPDDGGFRVVGNTAVGLMFGLLDLRDRLGAGGMPERTLVSTPTLSLRGDSLDFPFYLGVDLYNGRWRRHQKTESKSDWWWLNRGHWIWRLKRCADLRMNALLLSHPHPFPALLDLPEMEGFAYFPREHVQRHTDHFRWILGLAEEFGVKVYFLTWNIWTSPGFAAANGIKMEGTDSPLVRRYTRSCYRRLFESFPKLAGVMTMAGEAPPGCVDFVRDAIVGGLNELESKPELLYWIWCSYPEDAQVIFDEYRGKSSLVHYLQYEQLFRPQADPRIRRASQALGGVPVVTLGGLGTATGWLYWSDPYYIRDIMADLPRQNGVGCFFQGLDSFHSIARKWLGWQGLGRYWWDAYKPAEDHYWHRRIVEHYGVPEVAEDFLLASIETSRIPTRLLALLHRQTDHFMPQFGLPLVHYLGLPTLSTYVFENHEGIDEKGRLVPRLGLTWPNPDWGESVVGITEFVAGERGGTTPLQIADELEASARKASGSIDRLRGFGERVRGGPEEWNRCLSQMTLNVCLGFHTAQKIRAAVAWERWRRRQAGPEAVLAPLAESVTAMEGMADIASRLYAGIEIPAWRSAISRPPPWKHFQIWRTGRHRVHTFADSAALFRRELEWVRHELEARHPQPLLPFEDDLAPKPKGGRLLLRWTCDSPPPGGLGLHPIPDRARAATGSGAAPAPLVGQRLVAEHDAEGFWFPLTSDPARLPLEIGKAYWMGVDYWIADDAEENGDWLSAGARTKKGGWRQDVGRRYMGGPAGTRGRIVLSFRPHTWNDYYVYVSLHGRASIELDNLEVWVGDGGNSK